jgi:hypothetical protein
MFLKQEQIALCFSPLTSDRQCLTWAYKTETLTRTKVFVAQMSKTHANT